MNFKSIIINSKPYRERESLREEYINEFERLAYLLLGEEGKKMVKKYPSAFNFFDQITIPGAIRYGEEDESYADYDRIDISDRKIPDIEYDLSRVYYYMGAINDIEGKLPGGSKETERLKYLKERLENNARFISIIVERLKNVVLNYTKEDIKRDFPELYLKIRDHEKSKTK